MLVNWLAPFFNFLFLGGEGFRRDAEEVEENWTQEPVRFGNKQGVICLEMW